ncbi:MULTISPECIES: septal ring lytic transglycosylase RlpA family protein [Pseudoxanthomonas]|uniref:Endolytic peptidoglycan transglycosylase RlpA n=1 Tax=Pseudoxanthomonas winnipegensis TaxID=2480810 RepID=A0AAW8GE58_9GAMM|nr:MULTISPECIES: septal ring lytic transglycosylase RlpA family protein [Pseudoxanthomonas]MDQ1120112.1 rare lipoprotein A [Pseudoxanthomonas winnipegensis]MDQ1133322.1 rare lipoprotein A [Pseudoxanthomonas winnipegensis]MDR6140432.1 rare lipoprotein A [Pseudoxanthomonas sp. SORGH_AS_0997]
MKSWLLLALVATLAACSSAPRSKGAKPGEATIIVPKGEKAPAAVAAGCLGRYAPAVEDPSTRGDYTAGGLYKPGVSDSTPTEVPDVDCIAEPTIAAEPLSDYGNKSPYSVLGKNYTVLDTAADYEETGLASYYGQKFHGRKTSNHEVYDMYQFTAAHKTLPLPSFALVTNLDNGKNVIVRINDRGPFHDGRVIDLSYAAAVKLGITGRGTGRVEVKALHPDDPKLPALLASRNTVRRPVATTVATGVPTTIATGKPAAVRPSAMDQLVGGLPASSRTAAVTTQPAPAANAAAAVAAARAAPVATKAVPSDPSLRYYTIPNTKEPASADRFEAWMKSRGVHVATGKPGAPAPAPATAVAVATPVAAGKGAAEAAPAARPAPAPARPVASTASAGNGTYGQSAMAVLLQVASFASRDNAERALARLVAAGIPTATLSDVIAGGRTLWRVRVGAADNDGADALAARIAGLGFARPQVVRE